MNGGVIGKAVARKSGVWVANDVVNNPNGLRKFLGEKCLSFNGSDSKVQVASYSQLLLTNSFTIELWMKPANLNDSLKYLLSKNHGSNANSYALIWKFENNDVEFFSFQYTGSNPREGSAITIPDTNWHHVAYTYDGSTWSGYLDGGLVFSTSRTFSLPTGSYPFFLGSSPAGNYFNGYIDEVRVWNTRRTQVQLQANMRRPLDLTDIKDLSLVAYFPLNEGTGSLTKNLALGGNDGTISNASWVTADASWWCKAA